MRIELSCAECGSNRFGLAEADEDHSVVRCEDCGHLLGTLGDLKSVFAAEVLKGARAIRRDEANP